MFQPSCKKYFLFIFLFALPFLLLGQTIKKDTYVYATKNGVDLKMDIYANDTICSETKACLIFVFGGGFKEGKRDAEDYLKYFDYFAKKGVTVASIDYRLGMKGKKSPSLFNTQPLRNAISLAVSDLYSATNYILENANKLNIDSSKIIISGSSAGAITVLQADYELNNKMKSSDILPPKFRYAGVISFAGAIFSTQGLPDYLQAPAPTLFFHGSSDKLVIYKQKRFFNIGFFGSKSLSKVFRQKGFPYFFVSMEDIGHEVAEFPMKEFLPEIDYFIDNLVLHRKQWMADIYLKDKLRKPETSVSPSDYFD